RERRELADLLGRVAALEALRDLSDPLLETPVLRLEEEDVRVPVCQRALDLLEIAHGRADQRADLFVELGHCQGYVRFFGPWTGAARAASPIFFLGEAQTRRTLGHNDSVRRGLLLVC